MNTKQPKHWGLSLPASSLRGLLFASACLSIATLVSAQDTPPPSAAADQETITLQTFTVNTAKDVGYRAGNSVSATRVDTPIADLPFPISAFTSQFIQDTDSTDLYDVVRYSAGVTTGSREFNAGATGFMVRGFQQYPQHDGFFTGNQGDIYVDTQTVERVEVVKGPASLLYGQIAPGGTVNYITKRPEEKAFYNLGAEYGSYDYARGTVDVNQPIIDNKLLFRFNGAWTNGYQYQHDAKSKTWVVDPSVKWEIAKNLALTVNYQWFDRKETPPAVYMPNIDVVTPTLISAGFNAPYPSSSTGALAGNANLLGVPGIGAGATANGKAVALAPTVDVGFLEPYPGLSKTFNVASAQDYRDTDLENLNAELDGKIGDHWVARSNFIYAWNRSIQQSTGIGTVNMAPPGSLTWNGSSWAPSVAWLTAAPGLTLAQTQAAAEYAFAQQILANPSQALQAQNGPGGTSVGAPAVISRRSRWIESDGHSDTAAADFAGHYGFDWGTLKPVFGVYFDQQYQYTVTRQSTGTTASPYSQTWDVDPASPTYYINQNNFIPVSTVISQIANPVSTTSLAYTTDEAVYGLLNGAFLHDRLEVTGGARYNRSSEITTNLVPGTLPSAQSPGLKGIHDLTPQLGLGYKVTKAIMPYVSYSESYTLASQSSLRVASVPTFPAPPTTSRGLDAGVKTDLLNGRVSSTLSVYEIQQKNAVLTLNGFTSTGATSSTDFETNVHAKGIEYEITYSILNNWQIYGSMAEEDIRVTKFSDPNSLDQPGLYNVLLGEHPQGTAKTLANTWTRYTFNNGSAKGLWIGAGFNYNGKSLADNRNPYFFIPSYWLWNSAVGYDWTWGKVDLSAAVNWENMTNETYTPANQETGLPERILLSVSAKF